MLKCITIAAAALIISAPAFAQITFEAAPAVAPTAQAQDSKDASRLICQHEETVGTRLGGRKVCMTARQWADKKDGAREDVERAQRVELPAPPILEQRGCC